MKKIILIVGLLLVVPTVLMAQTPTPSPSVTPTPTVTPTPQYTPVPPYEIPDQPVVLYYEYTTQVSNQLLTNTETFRPWKTPAGRRLMITGISWSSLSAVDGLLEWDKSPTDRYVDSVKLGAAGQKIEYFDPPSQDEGGVSLILTTGAASDGVVRVNGILK